MLGSLPKNAVIKTHRSSGLRSNADSQTVTPAVDQVVATAPRSQYSGEQHLRQRDLGHLKAT
jgi:hypothetical protein